jgi:hypothetical protein
MASLDRTQTEKYLTIRRSLVFLDLGQNWGKIGAKLGQNWVYWGYIWGKSIRLHPCNPLIYLTKMVEVAGIEPASVSPTLIGDYMLSLCLKLTFPNADRLARKRRACFSLTRAAQTTLRAISS